MDKLAPLEFQGLKQGREGKKRPGLTLPDQLKRVVAASGVALMTGATMKEVTIPVVKEQARIHRGDIAKLVQDTTSPFGEPGQRVYDAINRAASGQSLGDPTAIASLVAEGNYSELKQYWGDLDQKQQDELTFESIAINWRSRPEQLNELLTNNAESAYAFAVKELPLLTKDSEGRIPFSIVSSSDVTQIKADAWMLTTFSQGLNETERKELFIGLSRLHQLDLERPEWVFANFRKTIEEAEADAESLVTLFRSEDYSVNERAVLYAMVYVQNFDIGFKYQALDGSEMEISKLVKTFFQKHPQVNLEEAVKFFYYSQQLLPGDIEFTENVVQKMDKLTPEPWVIVAKNKNWLDQFVPTERVRGWNFLTNLAESGDLDDLTIYKLALSLQIEPNIEKLEKSMNDLRMQSAVWQVTPDITWQVLERVKNKEVQNVLNQLWESMGDQLGKTLKSKEKALLMLTSFVSDLLPTSVSLNSQIGEKVGNDINEFIVKYGTLLAQEKEVPNQNFALFVDGLREVSVYAKTYESLGDMTSILTNSKTEYHPVWVDGKLVGLALPLKYKEQILEDQLEYLKTHAGSTLPLVFSTGDGDMLSRSFVIKDNQLTGIHKPEVVPVTPLDPKKWMLVTTEDGVQIMEFSELGSTDEAVFGTLKKMNVTGALEPSLLLVDVLNNGMDSDSLKYIVQRNSHVLVRHQDELVYLPLHIDPDDNGKSELFIKILKELSGELGWPQGDRVDVVVIDDTNYLINPDGVNAGLYQSGQAINSYSPKEKYLLASFVGK